MCCVFVYVYVCCHPNIFLDTRVYIARSICARQPGLVGHTGGRSGQTHGFFFPCTRRQPGVPRWSLNGYVHPFRRCYCKDARPITRSYNTFSVYTYYGRHDVECPFSPPATQIEPHANQLNPLEYSSPKTIIVTSGHRLGRTFVFKSQKQPALLVQEILADGKQHPMVPVVKVYYNPPRAPPPPAPPPLPLPIYFPSSSSSLIRRSPFLVPHLFFI